MKYFIAIALTLLVIIFMAVSVHAARLVSDDQPTAQRYEITGGPSWLPSTMNGTEINYTFTDYQEGTWAVKVRACKTDPLWGLQCSPEGNYTLTCPSPTGGLTAPVLRIEP